MNGYKVLVEKYASTVRENPNRMVADLSRQFGISEAQAVFMLPREMRVAAPVEDFVHIWRELATWDKVTFITGSPAAIIEYSGKLPEGTYNNGMFTLRRTGIPLGGHLMISALGSIWFVSKPLFGRENHSIRFYQINGSLMFSVYVGRGEDGELPPEVLMRYEQLRGRYEEAPE
jgi:putative heme utilization carrier protein HutX